AHVSCLAQNSINVRAVRFLSGHFWHLGFATLRPEKARQIGAVGGSQCRSVDHSEITAACAGILVVRPVIWRAEVAEGSLSLLRIQEARDPHLWGLGYRVPRAHDRIISLAGGWRIKETIVVLL
ncbi:unnamed protein product, partial [Ectocarpus sp. 12 AP-2014]